MKKHKNKLTKTIESRLLELAAQLPPMPAYTAAGKPIYKTMQVDGSELNLSGQKDANGNPGIPGQLYKANVLTYVNHYQQLVIKYQEDGLEEVERFCELLLDQHKQKIESHVPVVDPVKATVDYIGKRISFLQEKPENNYTVKELQDILEFIGSRNK